MKRKENAVSQEDKLKNKTEETVGRVKEDAGRAAGDRELEREGRAERTKGSLKQAGEKVKDAFRKDR
jgi:uncharacterized protein YjbJ (UPF0337 family)